jgi:sugar/nucleoside kinase (ribokinase family)
VKTIDIYGMCNPIFDLQAEVSHEKLGELGYAAGGMFLIDHEAQRALVPQVYDHIVNTAAGGSGANTIIMAAMLGAKCAYTGHLGADEHGRLYRQGMLDVGIRPNLGESDGDTGICVVLITPDAERTMITFLGLAQSLVAEDVNTEDLAASKYLYVTGYLWDTEGQKAAVKRAMAEANAHGVKVALSLSDPFCVNRHRDDFLALIDEHVDVLFGNDAEVLALTGATDVDDAARQLATRCGLVAVTVGKSGSILATPDDLVRIPVYKVEAVDSTGAGDAYAAGILFGLAEELPLSAAGRIASYVAGKVVGKLGPRLDTVDHDAIRLLKNGMDFDEIPVA